MKKLKYDLCEIPDVASTRALKYANLITEFKGMPRDKAIKVPVNGNGPSMRCNLQSILKKYTNMKVKSVILDDHAMFWKG